MSPSRRSTLEIREQPDARVLVYVYCAHEPNNLAALEMSKLS